MYNIESEKPAFEGFISGKDLLERDRVFVDSDGDVTGDLWFEVAPDRFVFVEQQDWAHAIRHFENNRDDLWVAVPLETLQRDYPNGRLIPSRPR